MKDRDMKVIVETKGNFMLLNSNGEEIDSNRPSVAKYTPFIDARIHRGDLRSLATGLPLEASDKEFAKALKESMKDAKTDQEKRDAQKLAVTSYCAEFGIDPTGEEIEIETETDLEEGKDDTPKEEPTDEEKEAKRQELLKQATELGLKPHPATGIDKLEENIAKATK